MRLTAYRRVLKRPGVTSLVLTMVVARIPSSAAGLVLILHITLGRDQGGLGRGYAAAGAVAAAAAAGGALGAPLMGRGIDRLGLRPILTLTTAVSTAFWCIAPVLSFVALLPAVVVLGFFGVPVFSLLRQALSTILPSEERQAGFSLDTMSAEISFTVGPVAAVVLVTQLDSAAAMLVLAATIAAAGVTLIIIDPPVRDREVAHPLEPHEPVETLEPLPVRGWLTGPVGAILLATAGSTLIFSGTDVTITASMRSWHAIELVGVVIAVWGLGSVVGGFIYGMSSRRWDPVAMLAVVGALTLPVSLATSWPTLAALMIPAAVCCGPLVSASADQLVARTPGGVRGVVLGSHSSALTVGSALGAPMAGLIIDATSPRLGFLGIGGVGLTLALTALGARALRRHARPAG